MTDKTHINDKKRAKSDRPWWVWCLYGSIFLLLVIFMAAYWVWSNRMGLLERLAIDTLAEDGVEAELTLSELTKTHLLLSNVVMRYESEQFFGAQTIKAQYQWRDLLDGKIERLEFQEPYVKITVDKDFKITDGWLPPGSGENNGSMALPPKGVKLSDLQLDLQTIYGLAKLAGDADIEGLDNLSATVSLASANLTYQSLSLQLEGQSNVTVKDGQINTSGSLKLAHITHDAVDAQNIKLRFDGRPVIKNDAQQFSGHLDISVNGLQMAQAELGPSYVQWDGLINKTESFTALKGQWSADLKQVILPDPARNKELAQRLSLSPALSSTPIAQHFVPDLEAQLFKLFTQSDITAQGRLTRDERGVAISITEPAKAAHKEVELILSPTLNLPVYDYRRQEERISARFDISLNHPVSLAAKNTEFIAKSTNGWRLDGIETFRADVSTQRTWHANNDKKTKLRPLKVRTRYNGLNPNHRLISLSGGIDYDGSLPGGFVEGLKTDGDMTVHLRPNRLTVDYAPSSPTITIGTITTTTGWSVHDFQGDLFDTAPLYDRRGSQAKITANLEAVAFIGERDFDAARLQINAQSLDLDGTLNAVGDIIKQNWAAKFSQATLKSDDIPGPDTYVDLGDGTFEASLQPDMPLEFSLSAPITDINSPLIRGKALSIDVNGSPDHYTLNHSGGLVKLTANDLPPMPLEGEVTFQDGKFVGETMAFLPQANNTPINIQYQIKDSAGTAIVDISELRFIPGGLQPQSLIPALRGKVARVDGTASAKINLAFAAGQPMKSSGIATLNNISFGTAPGPMNGVSTQIDLDSVLPLKTRGRQRLFVDMFDPGLPLASGIIDYELVPEGVKIYAARWPLGDGYFSLDPFTWLYNAEENRMTLRLEKVDLGEFINNLGNGALKATGELEGAFPIVISGINLRVENGMIRVPNGGRIQYAAAEADVLDTQINKYAGAAMETLRDFEYQELFAKINGPLDGEIIVGMKFEGKNDKVLNGQPFAFDVSIAGELFNILRNFNSNEHIKSSVSKLTRDQTGE